MSTTKCAGEGRRGWNRGGKRSLVNEHEPDDRADSELDPLRSNTSYSPLDVPLPQLTNLNFRLSYADRRQLDDGDIAEVRLRLAPPEGLRECD